MSIPRIENVITTLLIALVIQIFTKEIGYLSLYVKANILEYLILIGLAIIGVLIYRRK